VLPEGEISFFLQERKSKTVQEKINKRRFDIDVRFGCFITTSVISIISTRTNLLSSAEELYDSTYVFPRGLSSDVVCLEGAFILQFELCRLSQTLLFFRNKLYFEIEKRIFAVNT